jgi:hypothetical protein
VSKYKEHVEDMYAAHQELFDSFKQLHDKYALDPKKYQKEFNEEGPDVLRIIQRWESSLCGKSEGGKFGKFSSKLADKFWGEIRTTYPKIDSIGLLD